MVHLNIAVPLSGPTRFWDMAKYNKLWPITQQILCYLNPNMVHSFIIFFQQNLFLSQQNLFLSQQIYFLSQQIYFYLNQNLFPVSTKSISNLFPVSTKSISISTKSISISTQIISTKVISSNSTQCISTQHNVSGGFTVLYQISRYSIHKSLKSDRD